MQGAFAFRKSFFLFSVSRLAAHDRSFLFLFLFFFPFHLFIGDITIFISVESHRVHGGPNIRRTHRARRSLSKEQSRGARWPATRPLLYWSNTSPSYLSLSPSLSPLTSLFVVLSHNTSYTRSSYSFIYALRMLVVRVYARPRRTSTKRRRRVVRGAFGGACNNTKYACKSFRL